MRVRSGSAPRSRIRAIKGSGDGFRGRPAPPPRLALKKWAIPRALQNPLRQALELVGQDRQFFAGQLLQGLLHPGVEAGQIAAWAE